MRDYRHMHHASFSVDETMQEEMLKWLITKHDCLEKAYHEEKISRIDLLRQVVSLTPLAHLAPFWSTTIFV